MDTTSHFIGITVDQKLLVDLFVELFQYTKTNDIRQSVEFYNPLSTHITLYYFGKDINPIEETELKKSIIKINSTFTDKNIFINEVGFYSKDGQEKLCYLNPTNLNYLSDLNMFFSKKYPNDVLDNQQDFSPHISIFKIKDYQIYSQHRQAIQSIIDKQLVKIKDINICKTINLYSVTSKFKPEIQLIDF